MKDHYLLLLLLPEIIRIEPYTGSSFTMLYSFYAEAKLSQHVVDLNHMRHL